VPRARPSLALTLAAIGLAGPACEERPTAATIHDAGPPLSPLDAALFARPIPVVEAPPPNEPPPPMFQVDAGTDFEGEIDFAFGMPAFKVRATTVQLFVKGDQTAVVSKGKAGTMREVFRPKERAGYEVVEKDRTYERFSLDSRTPDLKVTRSKVVEKIAGGECEDWEMQSTSGLSRACVARGLGPYVVGKSFTATANWSAVLLPSGYFALRASLVDPDGGPELESMTVTRVVRQPVPDEIFTWPADYRDAAELDREPMGRPSP
jgi:Domain of unknown function (DUF4412)